MPLLLLHKRQSGNRAVGIPYDRTQKTSGRINIISTCRILRTLIIQCRRIFQTSVRIIKLLNIVACVLLGLHLDADHLIAEFAYHIDDLTA